MNVHHKKLYRSLCLTMVMVLGMAWSAWAQAPDRAKDEPPTETEWAKIEAARVALITTKLNMSPDQAEKFWPLYNDYNTRRKAIRKQMMDLFVKMKGKSEQERPDEDFFRESIKKFADLRADEVELDKDYIEKFMRVIKPSQVAKLYNTEKEVMRQYLRQRHHGKDGKEHTNATKPE